MNTRTRDTSANLMSIKGGVIHASAKTENRVGLRILFCNGRGVRGFLSTDATVTCKSCLKALKAAGLPTATTRTHESMWGREPITVDALVPTRSIDYHLARTHVGTPLAEVLDEVRAEVEQVSMGPQATLWTEVRIRETLAYAEWRHEENRAEYRAVMGGAGV